MIIHLAVSSVVTVACLGDVSSESSTSIHVAACVSQRAWVTDEVSVFQCAEKLDKFAIEFTTNGGGSGGGWEGGGRGEEWCPHSTSSRIIKIRGC